MENWNASLTKQLILTNSAQNTDTNKSSAVAEWDAAQSQATMLHILYYHNGHSVPGFLFPGGSENLVFLLTSLPPLKTVSPLAWCTVIINIHEALWPSSRLHCSKQSACPAGRRLFSLIYLTFVLVNCLHHSEVATVHTSNQTAPVCWALTVAVQLSDQLLKNSLHSTAGSPRSRLGWQKCTHW